MQALVKGGEAPPYVYKRGISDVSREGRVWDVMWRRGVFVINNRREGDHTRPGVEIRLKRGLWGRT